MEEVTNAHIVFLLIVMVLMFFGGWVGSSVYSDYNMYKYPKSVNGLWLPSNNISNKSQAIETANGFDTYGNWICINIRGMSIEQMINTCEHEVGHEIFAQKCENNVTKCMEAVK